MLWVKCIVGGVYYIISPGAEFFYQGQGPYGAPPTSWSYQDMSGDIAVPAVSVAAMQKIEAALKDKEEFIDLTE